MRKIFGEEVVTTEVSTYDPATTTTTFTMTPGTMANKTQIDGAIALARRATARSRRSPSTPGSRSSAPGPIVERFIEQQARDMQNKAVDVHARRSSEA